MSIRMHAFLLYFFLSSCVVKKGKDFLIGNWIPSSLLLDLSFFNLIHTSNACVRTRSILPAVCCSCLGPVFLVFVRFILSLPVFSLHFAPPSLLLPEGPGSRLCSWMHQNTIFQCHKVVSSLESLFVSSEGLGLVVHVPSGCVAKINIPWPWPWPWPSPLQNFVRTTTIVDT